MNLLFVLKRHCELVDRRVSRFVFCCAQVEVDDVQQIQKTQFILKTNAVQNPMVSEQQQRHRIEKPQGKSTADAAVDGSQSRVAKLSLFGYIPNVIPEIRTAHGRAQPTNLCVIVQRGDLLAVISFMPENQHNLLNFQRLYDIVPISFRVYMYFGVICCVSCPLTTKVFSYSRIV